MRICLATPNTLTFPEGGHLWVFLNWALGFQSLGHEITWLEMVTPSKESPEWVASRLQRLREHLAPFGLEQRVAICTDDGSTYADESALNLVPLEEAISCDVLCDHRYNLPRPVVGRFRRSMLIDIDPGQFQIAIGLGTYDVAPHKHYFTVGEWIKYVDVIKPMFSTHGHHWNYMPPPVALDYWPVSTQTDIGAMTTVSSWYKENEWMHDEQGEWYDNSKRAAFEPYLTLPQRSPLPLELCINIGEYQPELDRLAANGWRVRQTSVEAGHPNDYRRYLQQSLGEFSACKPSYRRMHTGWLSDRTACYLASGKPVVVEKTGQSDIFPDRRGILRFESPEEALSMLEDVKTNYAEHARAARAIAETHLDARKVLTRVLAICC
jgi:hypothetical protein